MNPSRFPLLIPLAAAALLAGCQSPHSAGQRGLVSVVGDQVVNASLETSDKGLARHVSLTGFTTQMLPNGLLKAEARLGSTDHRDYSVQYKCRWFDAAGMEVTDDGGVPWLPLIIHGGDSEPATAVAPRAGMTAVVVSVRHLK